MVAIFGIMELQFDLFLNRMKNTGYAARHSPKSKTAESGTSFPCRLACAECFPLAKAETTAVMLSYLR